MYIICGKQANSPNPDFQTLTCYFELGWEIGSTHVAAKRYLLEGKITSNDVIVTLPGREFLYASVFPKVITFERFCEIKGITFGEQLKNAGELSESRDLCWEFERDWDTGRMSTWPRWYFSGPNQSYDGVAWDAIQSVREADNILTLTDYLCVAVRIRRHQSDRNASFDYARGLLQGLRDAFKLPIYLVGQDLPDYDVDQVYAVSLESWIELLRRKSCRGTVGAYTGTTSCAALLAPKDSKLLIAPLNNCPTIGGNFPTGMGKCLNLNGNDRHFLKPLLPAKDVVEAAKSVF